MNSIRKPSNLFTGLIFLGIAFWALYLARSYDMGTLRAMGPGLYPAVLATILAAIGAVLVVQAFTGGTEEPITFSFLPLTCVSLGIFAFAVSLTGGGLFIATAVLVLVSAVASGRFRLGPALVLALGLAAGCSVAFVYGLGLQLPVVGDWFSF